MPKPEPPDVTTSPDVFLSLARPDRMTKVPEIFKGLLLHFIEQGIVGDEGEFVGRIYFGNERNSGIFFVR